MTDTESGETNGTSLKVADTNVRVPAQLYSQLFVPQTRMALTPHMARAHELRRKLRIFQTVNRKNRIHSMHL